MKILLLCEASWTVVSFRKELIEFLKSNNHEISLIMGDDEKINELSPLCDVHVIPFKNRGINPIKLLKLKKSFRKEIEIIKPDVVMTFFIKPNTVGVKAAKQAKVKNIFPFVEGLGDPFQPVSFKGKIIKFVCSHLYKSSFKKATNVFFLNNDDKEFFINEGIVKKDKSVLIKGIGIDTSSFVVSPLPKNNNVLLMARLIEKKGIVDFAKAARIVKKEVPDAKFTLIGKEAEITKLDLKEYIDDGSIIYDGVQSDVKKYINNSKIVVLPSYYREGLPRSLLEAISIGRPVIGYKNVGTNDVIDDGINGYLVKSRDIEAFANAIIKVLKAEQLALKMAAKSREIAVNTFDSKIINNQILKIIKGN